MFSCKLVPVLYREHQYDLICSVAIDLLTFLMVLSELEGDFLVLQKSLLSTKVTSPVTTTSSNVS